MARKRLGELLLERRAITPEQLESVLAFQRQTGGRIGQALVAKGYLTEAELCRTLGEALGLPVLEMVGGKDWGAVNALSSAFCERHELFPVALDSSHAGRRLLTVAMADPLNLPAIEEIEFTTGCKVKPALAPLSKIRDAIARFYHNRVTGQLDDAEDSGHMTVTRGASEEEQEISTRVHAKTGVRIGLPKKPPPPPVREVSRVTQTFNPNLTSRTELSELMRAKEKKTGRGKGSAQLADDLDFLLGTEDSQAAQIEDLERRFWALMRLMAKKGLITKEEFKKEFGD